MISIFQLPLYIIRKERKMEKTSFEFLELIKDPTLITNELGHIVGFNSKLQEILGMSMKELQQRSLGSIITSGLDYLKVLEQISGSTEDISSVDLKTYNEQSIKVNVKSKPFQINEMSLVMISFEAASKITDRYKHIPEELLSLHNYLYSSSNITRMDAKGNIISVNEIFCETLQYNGREIIGKPHDFLYADNHTVAYTADIWETLSRGEIWRGEMKNTRKDGSIFWTETTIIPTKKDDNEILEYVAIRYDISKKKAIEHNLDLTTNDLDTFIYKTNHDLRGPIARSIGLANLTKYEDINETARGYFANIQEELASLDSILVEMGESLYLKNEPITLSEIDVESLVSDKLRSYQADNLSHNLLLENSTEAPFITDKGTLEIVLDKLLDNAFKYSAESKAPKIKVGIAAKSNGVEISVENNGTRLSDAHFEKVFQPFYKANTDKAGKGLGLYLARLGANKIKGSISFSKTKNNNALVKFWLPNLHIEESTEMKFETIHLKAAGN